VRITIVETRYPNKNSLLWQSSQLGTVTVWGHTDWGCFSSESTSEKQRASSRNH